MRSRAELQTGRTVLCRVKTLRRTRGVPYGEGFDTGSIWVGAELLGFMGFRGCWSLSLGSRPAVLAFRLFWIGLAGLASVLDRSRWEDLL